MASPPKGRPRGRGASIAALLGVTAIIPACDSEEGIAPPIDYDATYTDASDASDARDGNDARTETRDGAADSTLVDLDGEADAGVFSRGDANVRDATMDHDSGQRGGGGIGGTGGGGGPGEIS